MPLSTTSAASVFFPEARRARVAGPVFASTCLNHLGEIRAFHESWMSLLKAGPDMFDGVQESGLTGWVLPRLGVPTPLRTQDTNRLAFVEAALLWMNTLDREELARPEFKETLMIIGGHLLYVVRETASLLLEGGALPQRITEAMANSIFGEYGGMNLVRIQIDMTSANEVDSHMGEVASAFRDKSLKWLQGKFGSENVFLDPAGTAFWVKTPFDTARRVLIGFRETILDLVLSEMAERKAAEPGCEVTWEDLQRFDARFVAYGESLDLRHLLPDWEDLPEESRREREALGIHECLNFLKNVASKTTYCEKILSARNPDQVLFTSENLPPADDLELKEYLRRAAGYVGPGVYRTGNPVSSEAGIREQHPKTSRLIGHLSRPLTVNGGGVLQRFDEVLAAIQATDEVSLETFEEFKRQIGLESGEGLVTGGSGVFLQNTLLDILAIGLAARRYAAYPDLIKPSTVHANTRGKEENAFFFAEELARHGWTHLAVSENDNAKARRNAYPPAPYDHLDSEFQEVREIYFRTAVDMDMVDEAGKPRVIISPFQGDCIFVGFDPGKIDPEAYLKEVQRRVRVRFSDQPFQAEVKLKTGKVWMRTPLWKKSEASSDGPDYLAEQTRPDGYEPLQVIQTLSMTYAVLPSPLGRGAPGTQDASLYHDHRKQLMALFKRMGRFIDSYLKLQKGSGTLPDGTVFALHKEGFGRLPRGLSHLRSE